MTASRELFQKAFRDVVLVKAKQKSFKGFAEAIGIRDSTLHQNIGTLYERRDFTSKFVDSITKVTNMSPDQLEAALDEYFNSTPVEPIQFVADLAMERLEDGAGEAYRDEVETILRNLPEKSDYWFITSEAPWEFRYKNFESLVADKIRSEVSINYVFPKASDPNFERNFQEFYGGSDVAWTTLARGFANFKQKLKESGVQSKALERMKCYESTNPFLLSPMFKLAYFETPSGEDIGKVALMEHALLSKEDRNAKCWSPVSNLHCEMIQGAIRALEKSEAN